jgi:photosystem II stability/assembly factor-like uncharacterized protein
VFSSGDDPPRTRQTAWERTNGPFGVELADVAVAPNGVAYAATYGYGLYRRAADADAWSTPASFDDNYFHSAYAASDGTVLVANDASGVLRSTDGGTTWQAIGAGLENTLASQEGCRLYDPFTGAHRRVYAFAQTPSGAYFAATDCGLYRADSAAGGWSYVGLRAYDLRAVVVHPSGALLAGSRYDGLFRSTDDGATWSRESFDGDAETSIISGLAVDEAGRVYAGTNVLHVSDDAGATWQAVTGTGDRFGYPEIVARPEGLYAASLNGLLVSADGTNWSVIEGLPETGAREYGTVEGVAFYSDGTALVKLINAGLVRSESGTQRWRRYNTGIQAVDVRSVASGPEGALYTLALQPDVAHRSLDGGQTWMPIDDLANTSVDGLFVDAEGTVYAASLFQLFRSTDRGDTWTVSNPQAGDLQYGFSRGNTDYRLAATVTPQGTLLVGAGPGGVYRSDDGGVSWEPALPAVRAADIAAAPEAAFVIDADGTVYRSDDEGQTWSRLSNTPLIEAVDAVPRRMTTAPGGGVLVTTVRGLYRLSAGGQWAALGLAGQRVTAARALDERTVLAVACSEAVEGDQVFLTTDGGGTWRNVSGGLEAPIRDVHDFAQGPEGMVYVAARGGVYRGIGPLAP